MTPIGILNFPARVEADKLKRNRRTSVRTFYELSAPEGEANYSHMHKHGDTNYVSSGGRGTDEVSSLK